MEFNKAVEYALRTWYAKDNPLHLELHHPLGKLTGEWGELLEDHMKILYKPNYEPETEKELGDIWYYLRILCYQIGYKPKNKGIVPNIKIDSLIATIISGCAFAFRDYVDCGDKPSHYFLDMNYSMLIEITWRNNLTLDDLTRSNWEKLKPGSERGEQWRKARC